MMPERGPVDDRPLPPSMDDLRRALRDVVPEDVLGGLMVELHRWARKNYGWQCGLDNPCDCDCVCCRRRHGFT